MLQRTAYHPPARPWLRSEPRRGVAAVEFAVILPLILLFLLGLWEVGRYIEAQQILVNGAREGARQASTGVKDVSAIKTAVVTYLQQKGISMVTTNDVTVSCINNTALTSPTSSSQLDQWRVTVSVSADNVKWVIVNKAITLVTQLSASADWFSMQDIPLTVNTDIPLN
ncbi:MAG: TadE/TadG family type IV pilus assembly protein [Gemmataceae bacterium]